MPPLSEQGQSILNFLVSEIRCGRFRLHEAKTFCGYKEIHATLGLPRKGFNWGSSLSKQGLGDLAKWATQNGLPAITGLVVSEAEGRPGPGYFNVNGVPTYDDTWWLKQIDASIRYDWSAFVADYEPITEAELAATSLMFVGGSFHRNHRHSKKALRRTSEARR